MDEIHQIQIVPVANVEHADACKVTLTLEYKTRVSHFFFWEKPHVQYTTYHFTDLILEEEFERLMKEYPDNPEQVEEEIFILRSVDSGSGHGYYNYKLYNPPFVFKTEKDAEWAIAQYLSYKESVRKGEAKRTKAILARIKETEKRKTRDVPPYKYF